MSHVYASPIFAARPGSTHGYDVTDPTRVNPELGGEAEFRAMAAAFRAHGLGLILDIVPNHMGVWGDANRFWLDVLAWGPESRHARLFDIDWQSPHPGLAGQFSLLSSAAAMARRWPRARWSCATTPWDSPSGPMVLTACQSARATTAGLLATPWTVR